MANGGRFAIDVFNRDFALGKLRVDEFIHQIFRDHRLPPFYWNCSVVIGYLKSFSFFIFLEDIMQAVKSLLTQQLAEMKGKTPESNGVSVKQFES